MQGGGYAPSPGYGLTASATTAQPTEQPSVTSSSTGAGLGATGTQRQQPRPQPRPDRTGESHFDSIFASSGWTREDVMVVAAGVQLLMWVALLYLEVTE